MREYELDSYLRHLEHFGPESVVDTAEDFLSRGDFVRLQIAVDEWERKQRSRHGFSVGRRHRLSPEELSERVGVLAADGLVPAAIADRLGVSDRAVAKTLRGLEDAALGVAA